MARHGFAALVLLAVVGAASLGSCAAADDVIAVSGMAQLEELVKKHPFLVVEFYAPWCGHCKKLEPEWAKAATALKGFEPEIVLAKVDATAKENEESKTKFGIRGFPTIKIFKGDSAKPLEYQGPRDEAGIVKYLKKQVLPAYVHLESADAVQAATKDSEVLVLAYLHSADSPELKTFAEVADALRNDMDFAYVTDHALLESCQGSDCKSPVVVMHKRDEKEQPRYEGEFTTDLLKGWAQAKSLPLVIKFGAPNGMKHLAKAFQSNSLRLIAVAPEESEELVEQLGQASRAADELTVILAVAKESKRLVDFYGLKPEGKTLLLIEDPKAPAKYLKAGAKPSDVPEFLREHQEGALQPWLKSEETPADNSGPVRVLTGKTFDAEVFKAGKDVFIEFYAPWCGHCKKLAPIWEEVGKELQGDDGVVIAKLDATANDVPTSKVTIKGYPTLYLVRADGTVIPYAGDRSKEHLLKFLADNRSTKPAGGKAEPEEEGQAAGGEEEEGKTKDEL